MYPPRNVAMSTSSLSAVCNDVFNAMGTERGMQAFLKTTMELGEWVTSTVNKVVSDTAMMHLIMTDIVNKPHEWTYIVRNAITQLVYYTGTLMYIYDVLHNADQMGASFESTVISEDLQTALRYVSDLLDLLRMHLRNIAYRTHKIDDTSYVQLSSCIFNLNQTERDLIVTVLGIRLDAYLDKIKHAVMHTELDHMPVIMSRIAQSLLLSATKNACVQ